MKGLNCFIMSFFIIRYFYLLLRKFRYIQHFHSFLLWSSNTSAIQFCIWKSCRFWLASIDKGLCSRYDQPECPWLGSSYAWGIYTCPSSLIYPQTLSIQYSMVMASRCLIFPVRLWEPSPFTFAYCSCGKSQYLNWVHGIIHINKPQWICRLCS